MSLPVDSQLVKIGQHLGLGKIINQILSDLILARSRQLYTLDTDLEDLSCPDRGLKVHLQELQLVQDLV